ncbi:MAG: CoA transferase, partial [Chloroflexi bacterium]|nr:CoA transferase [Chloroflexota bacterium]
ESYRFIMMNRNKKSIALNLNDEQGHEAFRRLVATADVLIDGFRPGVASRLGIDYASISQVNPRLVYCSLSGYGQDGPYAQLAGHDANYLSIAGVLGLAGDKDGTPVISGVQIADLGGGGMLAAIGILIALMARERTGQGQYIDVGMLDGALSWIGSAAAEYFATGHVIRAGQYRLGGHFACYHIYRCRDGRYLSLAALEPWFWANLCRYFGREDFADHQFTDGPKREETLAFFTEQFLEKSRDEWFEELKDKDFCVAPVLGVDETVAHPQVLHRGMVVDVDQPGAGRIKELGIPLKLSSTPGEITSPSPSLGQHTDEILRQVGYSDDQLTVLRQRQVIR